MVCLICGWIKWITSLLNFKQADAISCLASAKTSQGLIHIPLPVLWPWLCCAVLRSLSPVWCFATPWPVARQAPLSMGILQAKYWSGLPCPPPGDLPNPVTKSRSPTLEVDSLPPEPPGKPVTLTTSIQISCCWLQASQSTVLLVQECRLAIKAGQYGYAAPWLISCTGLTGASRSNYLLVSPRVLKQEELDGWILGSVLLCHRSGLPKLLPSNIVSPLYREQADWTAWSDHCPGLSWQSL